MDEKEVKRRTEQWLKNQGFKVKREVAVAEDRELIMDFYAYCDGDASFLTTSFLAPSPPTGSFLTRPTILWVECKGDQNLSELLEGFIRLELAVYLGGGLGILAVPNKATQKLLNYKDFLRQAENVIAILNVESSKLYRLSEN
jgi:hypothetical protein